MHETKNYNISGCWMWKVHFSLIFGIGLDLLCILAPYIFVVHTVPTTDPILI